ncbi:MAG TPA: hypothetical protein VGJ15_10275 [Pirellulales bacterium]|jgi:hypothetical protein
MSTAGQPNPKPSVPAPSAVVKGPLKPVSATTASTTLKQDSDDRATLRWGVYAILIAVSVGAMVGRLLAVNSVDQIGAEKVLQQFNQTDWQRQRPFLSGNDRSRWLTVRALVEKGTWAIDQYVTDPKTYPNWDSIDIVMHRDAAGTPHIYSSKPPLLTALYAIPYWAVYKVSTARGTPLTLSSHPYEIGRGIVLLVNIVPLVIYFFVIAGMLERYGQTDWGRILVMAAATLGTFLTTFAVVLNNHLPAAVCAAITLSLWLRIWYEGDRRWYVFALCGFFAAFTVACELPGLSLLGLVSLLLLWRHPRQTLLAYLPSALVVVAAYFGCNWIAHHNLIPPYAHREFKPAGQPNEVATAGAAPAPTEQNAPTSNETGGSKSDAGPASRIAADQPISNPAAATTPSTAPAATDADHFEGNLTLNSGQTVALRGNSKNWYDFEFTRTDGKTTESYWRTPKGIDSGEASVKKYALNLLIGHHGIFSLTPLWLLIIPGVPLLWWGKDYRLRELAAMIGLISVVVVVFYILLPQPERNYGGTTSAFRWVFWLAPLWLLAVLPVADKVSKSAWGRWLVCALLALSVLSAAYPTWNPWTHPWLWNLWTYVGWN